MAQTTVYKSLSSARQRISDLQEENERLETRLERLKNATNNLISSLTPISLLDPDDPLREKVQEVLKALNNP